ncbi:hypothetical protein CRG98_014186 [Punica granatum]|uniref:Uncharacterized protein n=1 Tax=Punica granatum TaxID=22663 RepID=A0A2I0KA84_PUNGR|nr:hypothetical protein CRG98_014186 [Punica granatum]
MSPSSYNSCQDGKNRVHGIAPIGSSIRREGQESTSVAVAAPTTQATAPASFTAAGDIAGRYLSARDGLPPFPALI